MNTFSVRYTMRGFPCELTITDDDTTELMKRAGNALIWLEQNAEPATVPARAEEPQRAPVAAPAVSSATNGNGHAPTPVCPTHGTPMKPSKHGNGYYCASKVADDDGTGKPIYCRQKA